MKFLKILFALLPLSFICSCVDTEENIVINEDNSGTYTSIMDMSKMLAMLSMMGSENNADKKMENMDSLIHLKDLMSSADSLSASEKELYKDGTIRIKLDKTNAEMKIIMSCPFKSIDKLAEIKENFMVVLNKMKAFEKVSGKEENAADKMGDDNEMQKAFNPNTVPNRFTAAPGLIENSIPDPQSVKNTFLTDSSMIMMKQMVAMMGMPTYKTVITAPRQIKSYSGNNPLLSTDKRSVTFTNTFTEMLEQPEKMAYKVEY